MTAVLRPAGIAAAIAAVCSLSTAPAQSQKTIWSGWLHEFLDGDVAAARAAYARAARAAATPSTLLALARLLEIFRIRNDEQAIRSWAAEVPEAQRSRVLERLIERLPSEDLDVATADAELEQRRARWIARGREDWNYCSTWGVALWPLFFSTAEPEQTAALGPASALRLKLTMPPRAPIAVRRRAAMLADLRLGGQRHGADRLEFDLVQRVRELPEARSWLARTDETAPPLTGDTLATLQRLADSPSLSKLEGDILRRANSHCEDLHEAGETEAAAQLLHSLPYRFR